MFNYRVDQKTHQESYSYAQSVPGFRRVKRNPNNNFRYSEVNPKNDFRFKVADDISVYIGRSGKITQDDIERAKKAEILYVENGVLELPDDIFCDCKNLKIVILPPSLKTIGSDSFSWCENLEGVVLYNGLENVGVNAFMKCRKLRNIYLPDTVCKIGSGVFDNCMSLESIKIPEGITEIGLDTFSNCTNLREVQIPESVKVIQKGAFKSCRSLKEITIPRSVKKIDTLSFEGCSELERVTFSSEDIKVLSSAFLGCDKLSFENITLKIILNDDDFYYKEPEKDECDIEVIDKAELPLFTNGMPDISDIAQKGIGDCWLMAELAAMAMQCPQKIIEAIEEAPDGRVNVTLRIRVSEGNFIKIIYNIKKSLFTISDKKIMARCKNNIWVQMFEKAFAAHIAEERKVNYYCITGNTAEFAAQSILGEIFNLSSMQENKVSIDDNDSIMLFYSRIESGLKNKRPITYALISLNGEENKHNLQEGHAYTVVETKREDLKVVLRDPHGRKDSIVAVPIKNLLSYDYRFTNLENENDEWVQEMYRQLKEYQ